VIQRRTQRIIQIRNGCLILLTLHLVTFPFSRFFLDVREGETDRGEERRDVGFRKSKGADVIQLLVSIYDSKEVFVKELQVLLAQRLLVIRDYQFEKEVSSHLSI